MSEAQKLTGYVVEILNDRELIINIGDVAGVKLGMRFRVLEPSREIKDPITGEKLGDLQREKVRVKITQTQPKFSVGRTYEIYKDKSQGLYPAAADIFQSPNRVRTLRNTDTEGTAFSPLDEKSSFVKIGDPVELIEETGS